jgi:hypothetical protein
MATHKLPYQTVSTLWMIACYQFFALRQEGETWVWFAAFV